MEHQPGDFEWWNLVVAFAASVPDPTVKIELSDFLTENSAPSLVYVFLQAYYSLTARDTKRIIRNKQKII